MKIPMSWLKDYVDVDRDLDVFCDAMTMSGTKVEGVEILGEDIQKVVAGHILSIEAHPDADKLVVTQVDVGETVVQIVTGAPNIKTGDTIPVALDGATLPGDMTIKKGLLRGIESNGMMCSVEELGLELKDYEEAPEYGVYVFPENITMKPGTDVKPYFGLDEVIIEFEVTSNRPDCFGLLGIAREVAATLKKPLKQPSFGYSDIDGSPTRYASVTIEDASLCARYMGRIVTNVHVAPSPKWMQRKLIHAGLRPINNIVDITNYILVEMGQPMHAFDVETLEAQQIIVRNAHEGETIDCLDGIERQLDPSVLVIADAVKPIAVAGIIGGESTKITDDTKAILFEAANFDGTSIRHATKKLGLRTDAAGKFVKYLDPNMVELAMNRACHLIELLGAGDIIEGSLDVYPKVREKQIVAYDVEKINALLGTDLNEEAMVEIFNRLHLEVDPLKKIVEVPTYRADITMLADLAEEVARFYGYDKVPVTLATGTPTVGGKNKKQKVEDLSKLVLESCGISEAYIYSFESPKVFDQLMIGTNDPLRQAVTITNPLGEDFSVMRTQTVHGMLQALATNYSYRNSKAYLYEIGRVYLPQHLPLEQLPNEPTKITIGMYGETDFYDIKGVVETLLESLNLISGLTYAPDQKPYLHPGRQGQLLLEDGSVLGEIGEVHPTVLEHYAIGTRAYLAVLDLSTLVDHSSHLKGYQPVPKYPAVNRDLAFLSQDSVMAQDIEKIIRQRGGSLLEHYELFDVYRGEQIQAGYQSLAYKLLFRAKDHTLEEKEISAVMQKIVHGLETELGAQLRK